MATATASLAPYTATAATIQANAGFISNNIIAFGMVKTADTGQTLPASLPAFGTTNAFAGYEIFRFNDALQSTAPVYVKIEYGCGPIANGFGVGITVGSSTDGAGNITGVKSTRLICGCLAATATPYTSFISGGPNGFRIALSVGSQTASYFSVCNIERSKDANGVDTGEGVIIQGYPNWSCQFLPFTGTIRAPQFYPVIPVPQGTASLADGANIGLVPILPFGQTGTVYPGNGLMTYYQPDLTALNAISVTIHGSNHTYMPLGVCVIAANFSYWPSFSYAMLYE